MADEVEIYTVPLESLLSNGFGEAVRLARLKHEREKEDARIGEMFTGKDHARQVWDEWDGHSEGGEEAHWYLNMIGDGRYCAV